MQNCLQCNKGFTISEDEKRLRDKIGGLLKTGPLPAHELCPDCRMQILMNRRNERTIYQRQCDKTGANIISIYPPKTPFPVFERTIWWGDTWDPLSYGRDFDFTRPFFEQFAELQAKVPRSALEGQNSENCDYCNFAFDSRNSYLSHNCYKCEGMLYSYWVLECTDCMDVSYCFQCERCIDCTDCNHSYNCRSCILSHNCTDSYYCYDCRGCKNCFGCVGLRQKSYCFFNEQLTKEEYEKRLQSIKLQNPEEKRNIENRLQELRSKHPHLYSIQEKTEDCTGDHVFESKNCKNCFQIFRSRDCVNVREAETDDALDCYHPGWSQNTFMSHSPVRVQNSAWVNRCYNGHDLFYSDICMNANNLFGCIGIRNSEYCILNKKYTPEEYEKMLGKIVEHMKKVGEFGRYFPFEISPLAYNECAAFYVFPLSKDEVKQRGWRWADDPPYTIGRETIREIPPRIEEVTENITKEILACEKCRRNYRIIPQELSFLKSIGAGLPRSCPECRHLERLMHRNPQKLYRRACGGCGKDIETTYAPERPETVVCNDCYLKKIY